MPHLRDFLKKRDTIGKDAPSSHGGPDVPNVTFIRSSTDLEEVLTIPDYPDVPSKDTKKSKVLGSESEILGFRSSANATYTHDPTARSGETSPSRKSDHDISRVSKELKRLSVKLHLHHHTRSRSRSQESSSNLPEDLPEAPDSTPVAAPPPSSSSSSHPAATDAVESPSTRESREAQWEKRATLLAMHNPLLEALPAGSHPGRARGRSPSIGDADGDVSIQAAIRLHEAGALRESTHMFGRLAEPQGANNALAQVLYGLALRHGWGVEPEPEKAIHHLALAASNAASVEAAALAASGMTRGGAAKGELVLAIFELANCFRHGWGVKVDPVAARQYYETAANLGDTDAMEEAAWCYLEGFGGAKDKFKAAQYLRLAERKGSKAVGNSWIWKDKYNPK